MQGIISAVRRNSLAELAGLKAGEKLCAVNGTAVRDIIELSYLVADEKVALTIEDAAGTVRQLVIEKYADEELGLEFEAAVFDKVTTCYNNCVFCFRGPNDTWNEGNLICPRRRLPLIFFIWQLHYAYQFAGSRF